MARSMRNRPVYNNAMNSGKQKQYDSRTLVNDAPYCQFCTSLLKKKTEEAYIKNITLKRNDGLDS